MDSVTSRSAKGFRWTIYSLAVVAMVLAAAMDDADARGRHRRRAAVSHGGGYEPPYASIVVDTNTGRVLQETNPDALRHPASLTKIMTLYLLFERLEAGKIKLGTVMTTSAHAASQSPTKLGLRPGSGIKVEDAIRGLVTRSANDAAVVIAEALGGDEDDFAVMMTKKAHALGMSRTVYRNASGLPNDEQVTTARDQATLGRAIQERFPRYYTYFSTPSFSFNGATISNHNRLIGRLEGVDGIKTGYTNASGFNLVTAMHRNGRNIVGVVLGGRSAGARDARMRDLVTEKIAEASPNRTAPMIADASEAAETRPAAAPKYALATSSSVPAPAPTGSVQGPVVQAPVTAPPQPVATRQGQASGTDAIKPIIVRTIKVKLSGVKTASLAPPTIAMPQPASDEAISTQSVPKATAGSAPIINPQPGVLGVLPGRPVAERFPSSEPAKAAAPAPKAEAKADTPVRSVQHSGWIIQVGAFPAEGEAKQRLNSAQTKAKTLLERADAFTESVVKGDKTLYRARFAGLDKERAEAACKHLKREMPCMTIKN
jgi:D-alanyl-D-alanine carboxypeptidase